VTLEKLKTELQNGTYRPGDIRRVWIPKAGGGERGLGIPNVIDRVVALVKRLSIEKCRRALQAWGVASVGRQLTGVG